MRREKKRHKRAVMEHLGNYLPLNLEEEKKRVNGGHKLDMAR